MGGVLTGGNRTQLIVISSNRAIAAVVGTSSQDLSKLTDKGPLQVHGWEDLGDQDADKTMINICLCMISLRGAMLTFYEGSSLLITLAHQQKLVMRARRTPLFLPHPAVSQSIL
jgi:hypothetical protein